jgi:hypothetical protein
MSLCFSAAALSASVPCSRSRSILPVSAPASLTWHSFAYHNAFGWLGEIVSSLVVMFCIPPGLWPELFVSPGPMSSCCHVISQHRFELLLIFLS